MHELEPCCACCGEPAGLGSTAQCRHLLHTALLHPGVLLDYCTKTCLAVDTYAMQIIPIVNAAQQIVIGATDIELIIALSLR